ncbi:MAG: hypothetical protein OYM47_15605 [Gemmatimonadota bacterium]|nr:hypothetical protein [Gemmatimonadota bacterium]
MNGLCKKHGRLQQEHEAPDATKDKANASNHKAMSYGREKKKASELMAQVKHLIVQAEDAPNGNGKCGDKPPESWLCVQGRLEHIRAAMAELKAEAQAENTAKKATREEKSKKRKLHKRHRMKPKPPSKEPDAKSSATSPTTTHG